MTFTTTEHEVFGLKAVTETLDEMLNHSIFRIFPGAESYLLFEGPAQEQLFGVFLVDFLAKPDAALVGMDGSHVEVLQRSADFPALNGGPEAKALGQALVPLKMWLDGKVSIEIWIESLGRLSPVEFKRSEIAWIAGNMAKHNVGRITRVTTKIEKIMARSGVVCVREDIREVVTSLHERFTADVLPYHTNALAEMLNNIRWAIHEYLWPVYRANYRQDATSPPKYRFEYPPDVGDGVARSCYWDLMNEVRRRPFIERFTVSDSYKVPSALNGKY